MEDEDASTFKKLVAGSIELVSLVSGPIYIGMNAV